MRKVRRKMAVLLVLALVLTGLPIEACMTKAADQAKRYVWRGEVTGWGGPDSYPSSSNHVQGTGEDNYTESTDMTVYVTSYGCGLELMNSYNPVFTGESCEMAEFIKGMKKPRIKVTLKNGGAASVFNWDEELSFPSGKEMEIPEEYLEKGYFALFGNNDVITQVEIYDAAQGSSTPVPVVGSSYEWSGEVTGWGGPDSYPSSSNHVQGTGEDNYTESTDMTVYVTSYGCGLELMNSYNPVFTGQASEMTQFIRKMKNPRIKVTLKNGGVASVFNWDEELSFPSGKEMEIPEGYLEKGYFALFGNNDVITRVEIYDIGGTIQTEAPDETEEPDITKNPDKTEVPDITENPDITESPDETELPDITENPDGTEGPDITKNPDKTELPDITPSPNETEKPNNTTNPEETEEPDDPFESEVPFYTEAPSGTPGVTGTPTPSSVAASMSPNPVRTPSVTPMQSPRVTATPAPTDNTRPAKTGISLVKGTKKGLLVKWRVVKGADGYQVQCSRNRGFAGKKSRNRYGRSVRFFGLKSKKVYFVRVRAYRDIEGKKVYGKWSGVRRVRVK